MEGLGEGAAEPKELAAKFRGHIATSTEIRSLCKDLQVRAPCAGRHGDWRDMEGMGAGGA